MKFSIATNFDEDLIHEIARLDKEHSIKVVYGKLKSDVIGGGRAAMILPEISMKQLKEYIDLCHENGLEFNYLLNPMCLGNKDLVKSTYDEIVGLIDDLVECGIDWVTVNSPNLCKLIKRKYPKIKISVGLHACVSNLQNIENWINMGVDEITLQLINTRNFPLIEKMLNYTKGKNVDLRVIANTFCLHNCSYRISHSSGQAHASSKNESTEKQYMDYYVMSCTRDKVNNPTNFVAADWIRPEDVKYYEQLCEKTGNYNFSIKLAERTKSTSFLVRVVKAYLSRSYDGNLLDLMLWPSKETLALEKGEKQKEAFEKMSDEEKQVFTSFTNFYNLPDVYVDNKKLDGFINKFVQDYTCGENVCQNYFDDGKKDMVCSYCKGWAEKVVKFDADERERWLKDANSVLDNINKGIILK